MNKIIGFLITQEKASPRVDVFDVGLQMVVLKRGAYDIYIWGIGDVASCVINDTYALSFPLHDSVLDRNVLIRFDGDAITVENDWLGSIPVFYNEKEKTVSTLSRLCLGDNREIHPEGLANFCDFGYSVFEQTVFTDVKFMRYYSRLVITDDAITVMYKDDPVLDESFLSQPAEEGAVIAQLQQYITDIESQISGDIIVPTSGGFDSRLLNYLITDKKRICSFTYGITADQSQSTEVVHAKKISEIYHTQWKQIELTSFHDHIDQWFAIHGFSTHLHGMYHIEFYTTIMREHTFYEPSFLSGIIGDAWAEKGKIDDIADYQDIYKLGYAHGMNLDPRYVCPQNDEAIKRKFYAEHANALRDDRLRTVFSMRMKLMLLSYLLQVPEYFGMPAWTPFLNFSTVRAMLSLPDERRADRQWQRDFFARVGLDLENMNLPSVTINRLNYEVAQKTTFEPIDVRVMRAYVDENRLQKINAQLSRLSGYEKIKAQLLYTPKISEILKMMGVQNEFLRAMYDYYVVKAIEKGVKDARP
jgi:hypothetical protein